jgi:tRNA modification GTPase
MLAGHEPAVLGLATKCDVATPPPHWLATSAISRAGLPALRDTLADRARQHHRPALAPSLSRCRHHVDACLEHLRRAHALALHEEPPELLALELRGALDELGAMVGAVYTDDLLDRIFSRFCIGK